MTWRKFKYYYCNSQCNPFAGQTADQFEVNSDIERENLRTSEQIIQQQTNKQITSINLWHDNNNNIDKFGCDPAALANLLR